MKETTDMIFFLYFMETVFIGNILRKYKLQIFQVRNSRSQVRNFINWDTNIPIIKQKVIMIISFIMTFIFNQLF